MAVSCPLSLYLKVQFLDLRELVTGHGVALQKAYLLKAEVVDT